MQEDMSEKVVGSNPSAFSTHKIFINVCLHQLTSETAFTCHGEMSLRHLADVPQLKNIKTDFMVNCSANKTNQPILIYKC